MYIKNILIKNCKKEDIFIKCGGGINTQCCQDGSNLSDHQRYYRLLYMQDVIYEPCGNQEPKICDTQKIKKEIQP